MTYTAASLPVVLLSVFELLVRIALVASLNGINTAACPAFNIHKHVPTMSKTSLKLFNTLRCKNLFTSKSGSCWRCRQTVLREKIGSLLFVHFVGRIDVTRYRELQYSGIKFLNHSGIVLETFHPLHTSSRLA